MSGSVPPARHLLGNIFGVCKKLKCILFHLHKMSEMDLKEIVRMMDSYEKRLAEKESRIEQLEMKLNKMMKLMEQVDMVEEDTYEDGLVVRCSLKTRLDNMECSIENLE